ncbi:hypothetical protein IQ22_03286 [Pseudomonas duriflava]|uniref:Uncharacterized protein n=1 Tax=Pseudomonas duriflava TaxID=459528 RepID=A0A562Q911_9PSED|nr:hypothetical protein IQ22_03286 [Pseudomonas duriflava]
MESLRRHRDRLPVLDCLPQLDTIKVCGRGVAGCRCEIGPNASRLIRLQRSRHGRIDVALRAIFPIGKHSSSRVMDRDDGERPENASGERLGNECEQLRFMHLRPSTNADRGPSEQVRHVVLDGAHIAHAPVGELRQKLEPAAGIPVLNLHRALLEPLFQLRSPEHFAADRTVEHFAKRNGQFRAGHGFSAEIIVLRTMAFRTVAQDLGGNGGQIVKRDVTHAVLPPPRMSRTCRRWAAIR